jgi:hypothetical protein
LQNRNIWARIPYYLCIIACSRRFENIQTLTDGELIAKAIVGREDGFEELVRRYQTSDHDISVPDAERLRFLARRYAGSFLKVYNSLRKYSSDINSRLGSIALLTMPRSTHAKKFGRAAEY